MVIFSELTKVLIADTDTAFVDRLNKLVTDTEKYSVCSTTRNGRDTLDEALVFRPDVLLISLALPEIDGFGVIERYRRESSGKAVSVIAFTNEINSFVFEKATAIGIDYLFTKPISEDTLMKRLDGLSRHIAATRSIWANGVSPGAMIGNARRARSVLITEYLNGMRIYPNLSGYHYLREAIDMAIDDATIVKRMTTELYPRIARKFSTTPCAVERSIRGAIERSFRRADVASLYDMFGYTVDEDRGKPTNSQFIALFADRIKNDLAFTE